MKTLFFLSKQLKVALLLFFGGEQSLIKSFLIQPRLLFHISAQAKTNTLSQVNTASSNSNIVRNFLSSDELNTKGELQSITMDEIPLEKKSTAELKSLLLHLLEKSTLSREELTLISDLVNVIEANYTPMKTLEFLNYAMEGGWRLLFSTNQLGIPQRQLLLGSIEQTIETDYDSGVIATQVSWDLKEDDSLFSNGNFIINTTYQFQQQGRMIQSLASHKIENKGKTLPNDVQNLVSLLYKSIPNELFDPNNLGLDITFLDEEIKIVRVSWVGGEISNEEEQEEAENRVNLDGVRNIFIRKL